MNGLDDLLWPLDGYNHQNGGNRLSNAIYTRPFLSSHQSYQTGLTWWWGQLQNAVKVGVNNLMVKNIEIAKHPCLNQMLTSSNQFELYKCISSTVGQRVAIWTGWQPSRVKGDT